MDNPQTKPDTQSRSWKVWLYLWLASIIATIAVLPYVLALQGDALNQAAAAVGTSINSILALQLAQGAVLAAIFVWVGLWAARRGGFTLPLLDALAAGHPLPWDLAAMRKAVLWGLASGAAIIALDLWVFAPFIASDLAASNPPAWMGLLASLYGGITEEVMLRLFLLSLLALGLRRAFYARDAGTPVMPARAFWMANIIAAIIFGLGHLPATAALIPLTGIVVMRALVLNALVGIVCGQLYRKHGFEMAILAHFSADIVLHVLFPMLA